MCKTRQISTAILALSLATFVAGCSSSGSDKPKRHYAAVYTGSDGQVYCHAGKHDGDNDVVIWYLLYVDNQPAKVTTTNTQSDLSKAFSSGSSWRSVGSAQPSVSLSKSGQVVEENENDEPAADSLEDESDVSADDVTDQDTTNDDVQNDTADDNGGSDQGGDNGGGDDGGGDFGGDAGGDAGGGD